MIILGCERTANSTTAPPREGSAAMNFNKNIGMLLLAVYLILVGIMALAGVMIPSILLGIVALAAGILILIGR
jgi:hypothetical protein